MRLIKGNVERIAESEVQILKLEKEGFVPLKTEEEEIKAGETVHENDLENMTAADLKKLAKAKGIEGYNSLSGEELLVVLKDVV